MSISRIKLPFVPNEGGDMMLVMIRLCRYLKFLVVMMHWVLSLTVRMVLLISAMCYLVLEVFTTTVSFGSYIVLSNYMPMSKFFNSMLLLGYILII